MQKGRSNHPFVESSENRLGIGKLTAMDGETAIVEYFRSPVDDEPICERVSKTSLTRKILHPETRAYHRNPETDRTEVGRVLHYQSGDDLYLVRFPNDQPRMLSSDEFQVRCRLPIQEPTDHLASQVNETAFWHAARSTFVQHLLEQHRMSGGLSALLSSSVDDVFTYEFTRKVEHGLEAAASYSIRFSATCLLMKLAWERLGSPSPAI